jgi:aminoglycoside phosphotransferase (APT) family kinase protein
MDDGRLAPIPIEHQEKAHAALDAAFGRAPRTLQPVVGGASGALTYRVEAGGHHAYLMRMETRRDALRNPHQNACMRIAAEAGVAPPLRYLDDAAGVAIMDFLPQRPLAEFPGGPAALVRAAGELVARLQATPAFPFMADYPHLIERLFAVAKTRFAPGLLDPHEEGFRRIREAYRWDRDTLVSSHNDPNTQNLLFDGERLWLIDWETAYRNDPLTDIAIVANNLAPTPELETALVEACLGRAPDRLTRARLTLMRQIVRLYYGSLIFTAAVPPTGAPDASLAAPTEAEFMAAMQAGRLVMGNPQFIGTLGKMSFAGFLAGLTAPGFEDALAVARAG